MAETVSGVQPSAREVLMQRAPEHAAEIIDGVTQSVREVMGLEGSRQLQVISTGVVSSGRFNGTIEDVLLYPAETSDAGDSVTLLEDAYIRYGGAFSIARRKREIAAQQSRWRDVSTEQPLTDRKIFAAWLSQQYNPHFDEDDFAIQRVVGEVALSIFDEQVTAWQAAHPTIA